MTTETQTNTDTKTNAEQVAELESLRKQVEKTNGDFSAIATALLVAVPEHLKPLIPSNIDDAAKVQWFLNAQKTGVFNQKPIVPETDTRKPPISPKEPDFSTLPPVARMARGYKTN